MGHASSSGMSVEAPDVLAGFVFASCFCVSRETVRPCVTGPRMRHRLTGAKLAPRPQVRKANDLCCQPLRFHNGLC